MSKRVNKFNDTRALRSAMYNQKMKEDIEKKKNIEKGLIAGREEGELNNQRKMTLKFLRKDIQKKIHQY